MNRPVALGLSLVALAAGAALFAAAAGGRFGTLWAVDAARYVEATARWMETGTPYIAAEVAGPFDYTPDTFLHPPIALWLFLPFTVLPLPLFWIVPLGVTVWVVWSW